MWLAYVNIAPASAMDNLAQHFRKLEFDAEHESIYGKEKFYTKQEYREIASKYQKGVVACKCIYKILT